MNDFIGFPKELPQFFNQLKKNNTKLWFQTNKKNYEAIVKAPSQEFVCAMGEKLKTITPGINAIPKVNKSLFRINRDTRFSPDKSPYKTNMGILFWAGDGKRMESSGFYFHLEDNVVMIGCGLYMFPKPILQKYRESIVDKKAALKLKQAIKDVLGKGYVLETKHYKRIPRGFDATTDFEKEYLLYNGLTARIEFGITDTLFSSDIIDLTFEHFQNMLPIHEWISDFLY